MLSDQATNSANSSRVSSFTSTFSTSLKSFSSFFTLSNQGSENSLPLHERHSPSNTLSQGNPTPHNPNTPPTEPEFLPICYSEGRYATRLLQPELVTLRMNSDRAFFKLLRDSYQSTRGKWTSMFSLQTLSWIKFVHFELYCSELVDVRKVDDIPPPEHAEYRYAPVLPDVIQPSTSTPHPQTSQDVLLTPPSRTQPTNAPFQHPNCAASGPILMQRFPKKLVRPLTCPSVNPLTPGWGIFKVAGL